MVSCLSGWLATLNIVSSQFKSHQIPLNSFYESPRVRCLDSPSLSCIPLHSALFCPRSRILTTTYTQMTLRSTTPSTHPVLKNQPKTSKTHACTIVSVQDWMNKNKLKLNPDKTEFLLIGNKRHRKNFTSSFPIDILGNQISPTQTARNLGVNFDSDFNFIPHIKYIIKG